MLLLLLVGLPFTVFSAQNGANGQATQYYYRFANEKFLIQKLEIEFDHTGKGTIRFLEQDQEEIENPLQLKPATVARMADLFEQLDFLNSQEVYQTEKQFPHMGTATIRVRRGNAEREVSFNYTANKIMMDLWQRFRGIENQEYRMFKLDLAMRYQPLSTPQELNIIESLLKSKNVAEPDRFLPVLREIAESDQLMTIARSKAEKLVKLIEAAKK